MSIKSKIAAFAASPFLFAGAAFAEIPYVNVEANSNYTGDDYTSTSTELQLGYEGSNSGMYLVDPYRIFT